MGRLSRLFARYRPALGLGVVHLTMACIEVSPVADAERFTPVHPVVAQIPTPPPLACTPVVPDAAAAYGIAARAMEVGGYPTRTESSFIETRGYELGALLSASWPPQGCSARFYVHSYYEWSDNTVRSGTGPTVAAIEVDLETGAVRFADIKHAGGGTIRRRSRIRTDQVIYETIVTGREPDRAALQGHVEALLDHVGHVDPLLTRHPDFVAWLLVGQPSERVESLRTRLARDAGRAPRIDTFQPLTVPAAAPTDPPLGLQQR